MNKVIGVLALAAGLVCGCKHEVEDDGDEQDLTQPTSTTYAVVVGMENSAYAGACPGAGYDAKRMKALLSRYTPHVTLLMDGEATKEAVMKAVNDGIAKSELFIYYYSGHGGSDRFADTGAEEVDGMDEYYCLYDTYMRDNDMWNMIKKSNGRVVLINDCCHSETIYRAPCITLRKAMSLSAEKDEEINFSMLCWSGCPDDTYSYGSETGGKFTNTLIDNYNYNKTYEQIWEVVSSDKALLRFEIPQETIIGEGFDGKLIFQ